MYRVMLVDDEYMILEGLKQIIPWQELGFEVVKTAKRGQEALDYLENNKIDLLITDVTMPKISGIDLVKEIRKSDETLPILILSGYQEFEYVKQGIELGVKGYLVKPVNKDELKQKVIQIKNGLAEKEQLASQKELYFETRVQRWLNDEMSEDEFFSFIRELKLTVYDSYSVIIIKQKHKAKFLESFGQKMKQPFIIDYDLLPGNQTVIVYQGKRTGANQFIDGIEKILENEEFTIVLGESVTEWENVYESFEKAKKLLQYQEFYETNNSSQRVVNLPQKNEEENLHFLSFNKALIIGDVPTIKEELDRIYHQMADFQYLPDDVRHVTFLLFTDIYRQYPSLDAQIYDSTLTKIHKSSSMKELKNWLDQVLTSIYDNPDLNKRYSDLVKGAINIISQKYEQDLSLKSVSEILHVNSVYLGQLFKKETERSFSQYLNQVRIKKAQYQLLHSDKSINEVGYDIGYNNPTYFFKMFRKLNGLTPKEFREKYLTNYQDA